MLGAPFDDALKGSAYVFSANAQVNPLPLITSISPGMVIAGSAAFTLTVNGSNFVPGSVVRFNGVDRGASAGSTQLTAVIPATDIATPGTATITVVNPTPGGGSSNPLMLTIAGPVVSASAASFQVGLLAPEAIVAAFGTGMAVGEQAANTSSLPSLLLGNRFKSKTAPDSQAGPTLLRLPATDQLSVPADRFRRGNGERTSGMAEYRLGLLRSRRVPGTFHGNLVGLVSPRPISCASVLLAHKSSNRSRSSMPAPIGM